MSFPLTIPASLPHQQPQYVAGSYYTGGVVVNSAGADICRLVSTDGSQVVSSPSLFVSQSQHDTDSYHRSTRMFPRSQQEYQDSLGPSIDVDQSMTLMSSSSSSSIPSRDHPHSSHHRKRSSNNHRSAQSSSFDQRTLLGYNSTAKCPSTLPERTVPMRKKSVFVAPSGLFAIQQQAAASRSRAMSCAMSFSPSPPPLAFSPPPLDDLPILHDPSDPYHFAHPSSDSQRPLDLSSDPTAQLFSLSNPNHNLTTTTITTTSSPRSHSVIHDSSSIFSSSAGSGQSLVSQLTVPSREHISQHISKLILDNKAIIESFELSSVSPSSNQHHNSQSHLNSHYANPSKRSTSQHASSQSSAASSQSKYSTHSATSASHRRYSTDLSPSAHSSVSYSKLQSALLGEPPVEPALSGTSAPLSSAPVPARSHSKAQHSRKYSEISVPSHFRPPSYHQSNAMSLDHFKFPVQPIASNLQYFHSPSAVPLDQSLHQHPTSQAAYNSHLHPNQLSVIINARDQHQSQPLTSASLDRSAQDVSQFSPIGVSSRSSSEPSLVRNLLTSKTSPFAHLKCESATAHNAHSSSFSPKSSDGSIIKNLLLSKSRTNSSTTNPSISPSDSPQTSAACPSSQPGDLLMPAYPRTSLNEPARKKSRPDSFAWSQQQGPPPLPLPPPLSTESTSTSVSLNSGSVFACDLCHVAFRNRQNFEVHQRVYCRGKPSTTTTSTAVSTDQLTSAIRKRSYHHYFEDQYAGGSSMSPLSAQLAPAIREEEPVRRSSVRKVSMQERPTIITYHVPSYREHRGQSMDSIDSDAHCESLESASQYSGHRLSQGELSSPSAEAECFPQTTACGSSSTQPDQPNQFGHILKSKLLGSSFMHKRRKTSEPAFSYNYELKHHARESFAKQPSHHRHVSTLAKPSSLSTRADLATSMPLEILPAYMPHLNRPPVKITIKGTVQFAILNELIEAGTNHEFVASPEDNSLLDDNLQFHDQRSVASAPLWDRVGADSFKVKVEQDEFDAQQCLWPALAECKVESSPAEQLVVDPTVKETVDHLLDLVAFDNLPPHQDDKTTPLKQIDSAVVDLVNELLDTVESCSGPTQSGSSIAIHGNMTTPQSTIESLPKKCSSLPRPTTLNLATYDQSARKQNEFGTSRLISTNSKLVSPKLSIFVNRCSDQDLDLGTTASHHNHQHHRQNYLIASTLVSPDTPRSKRKYQQLLINGNAFTNLDLKVTTRTTFCCLYPPQPMFVTQEANPQLSMYSQWKTSPIPLGDILELLPGPHSLLCAYNSQEAVFHHQHGSTADSSLPTSSYSSKPVSGCQCQADLVNSDLSHSSKCDCQHRTSVSEHQSGTRQFFDKISSRLSTIYSATATVSIAQFPGTNSSSAGSSRVVHQSYDRTLCAIVIPLGQGHSDRVNDSLTSPQSLLVHSNHHYQSQQHHYPSTFAANSRYPAYLRTPKRSRGHLTADHHSHPSTVVDSSDTMVVAVCLSSTLAPSSSCALSTASLASGLSTVDSSAVTSGCTVLPPPTTVVGRPRKRSSNISMGLQMSPSQCHDQFLSQQPMLGYLPIESRQKMTYIMMMSQSSPALSIPTVGQMATSINFAARKFSECIGLRHPNHQQYEENWATRLGPDGTEELIPKRIKIFEGGFKSNEDYTYVRGRGRGKYVCEECGIRCKKPSMLKKHIRTHTDLRPYSCRHCAFAFKTKGNLTKHMKSKAHYKKCVDMGIVPVPISIDDSQIDSDALAKQEQYELSVGSNGAFNQFADDDDDCDDDFEDDDIDDEDDDDDEGVPIPLIEQQRLTYIVPGQFDDADNIANMGYGATRPHNPLHDSVRKLSTPSRKNSTNSSNAKNGSNSSISSGYSSTTSIFNDLQQRDQLASSEITIPISTAIIPSGLMSSAGTPLSDCSQSEQQQQQSQQTSVTVSCPSNHSDMVQSDKIPVVLPTNTAAAHRTDNGRSTNNQLTPIVCGGGGDSRDCETISTRPLSANMAPVSCKPAIFSAVVSSSSSSLLISGERSHSITVSAPTYQPAAALSSSSSRSNQHPNSIQSTSTIVASSTHHHLSEITIFGDDASDTASAVCNSGRAEIDHSDYVDHNLANQEEDANFGDDNNVQPRWRRKRRMMVPMQQLPARTANTTPAATNEPEAEAARSLLILSGFGQQVASSVAAPTVVPQSQSTVNTSLVEHRNELAEHFSTQHQQYQSTRKLSFPQATNQHLIEPLSEKIILNGIVVGERRRRPVSTSINTSTATTGYHPQQLAHNSEPVPGTMLQPPVLPPHSSRPSTAITESSGLSSSSSLPSSNQTSVIISRRSSPIIQPQSHNQHSSKKVSTSHLPQSFQPRDSSSPIDCAPAHPAYANSISQPKFGQTQSVPSSKNSSAPSHMFSISSLIGQTAAVSSSGSTTTSTPAAGSYLRYSPITVPNQPHPYAAIIADDIQKHATITTTTTSQDILFSRGQLLRPQPDSRMSQYQPGTSPIPNNLASIGSFIENGSVGVQQHRFDSQQIQFANSTLASSSSRSIRRSNASPLGSIPTDESAKESKSHGGASSSSLIFQNSSIKNVCEPSSLPSVGYLSKSSSSNHFLSQQSSSGSSLSPPSISVQHFSPSSNVPLPPPPSSPFPAPTTTVATDKRPLSSSSSNDGPEQPMDLSAKSQPTADKETAGTLQADQPPAPFNSSRSSNKQKHRLQSVESKQHLTEQITRAFSPLSEMQTLPVIEFPTNHHHHQQNHPKKSRELYNSLRSEDFVHLTPGVHTPHRLPQSVPPLSTRTNGNSSASAGNLQSSHSSGVISGSQQTGGTVSTSGMAASSRSTLAMQKNSVILSSYTTSEGKSVCTICMKQFSKLSLLRLHVNIHFFERPFRCDSCAISFRTKGHLQKHSRSVSHLNKLNMNITFGRASTDNPRPFKCSDCKIAFRIHGHLAKHLRSKMHIMKLECLGKLPFGMFAEMERSSTNLNLIDTTNCEKALETLRSLAQKLYDPRQMCWKVPTIEDQIDAEDDDSNLMLMDGSIDGDEMADGDDLEADDLAIDGDESFDTSSTSTGGNQPPDTNDNSAVNFNIHPRLDSPLPPNSVIVSDYVNQPSASSLNASPPVTLPSNNVVANVNVNVISSNPNPYPATTCNSSLGGILASTRSNTCHICGRLFKGAKFLQVHLYCDHPEGERATTSTTPPPPLPPSRT